MSNGDRLTRLDNALHSSAGKQGMQSPLFAGHMRPGLQTQTLPFSIETLDGYLDLDEYSYLEVRQNSRVYPLACTYIGSHGTVQSSRYAGEMEVDSLATQADSPSQISLQPEDAYITTIGLGLFPFKWREHELYALHQTVGQPVGTGGGVEIYHNLVLFARTATPNVLGRFCRELVAGSERTRKGVINVFEWNAAHQFWQMRATVPARPMESVVLPHEMKGRLLDDLQEFLGPDTRQWYKEHGIPHKRGYLFYGVPGGGKTSLIQAVAGKFEYNICYVHLTHPRLTDDSLREAVNQAPKRSVLVFEDVDAIFGRNREKLLPDSPLTFSGLLNAIDGIGKADGQIFILTTNHRDRLSPALIRNGRADVHVQFTFATDEQIFGMFRRFYPLSTANPAQQFVNDLRAVLHGREVSPASLQHFFIQHRKSTAMHAVECVQDMVVELDLREDEQRLSQQEPRTSEAGTPKAKL
jgi:chaperone BCS1